MGRANFSPVKNFGCMVHNAKNSGSGGLNGEEPATYMLATNALLCAYLAPSDLFDVP